MYSTVYTVFVGWNLKTHAAEALGQKHKWQQQQQITQIQIILCSALQCQHILPKVANTTQSQNILNHYCLLCPSKYSTVHCLNPLYISNSHCHRKTKRRYILESIGTLGAGAARQNKSIDFAVRKDKSLLSSCTQQCKAHFIWGLFVSYTGCTCLALWKELNIMISIGRVSRDLYWITGEFSHNMWENLTLLKLFSEFLVLVSSSLWKAAALSLD